MYSPRWNRRIGGGPRSEPAVGIPRDRDETRVVNRDRQKPPGVRECVDVTDKC